MRVASGVGASAVVDAVAAERGERGSLDRSDQVDRVEGGHRESHTRRSGGEKVHLDEKRRIQEGSQELDCPFRKDSVVRTVPSERGERRVVPGSKRIYVL